MPVSDFPLDVCVCYRIPLSSLHLTTNLKSLHGRQPWALKSRALQRSGLNLL